MFTDFRERKGEEERETHATEKHALVASCMHPDQTKVQTGNLQVYKLPRQGSSTFK